MAWLFAIKGVNIRLNGGATDSLDSVVNEVDKSASDLGLKAVTFMAEDGGESVLVGVELLPDRHIYQGQCLNIMPDGDVVLSDEQIEFMRRVEKTLEHFGFNLDVPVDGLFLAQFD